MTQQIMHLNRIIKFRQLNTVFIASFTEFKLRLIRKLNKDFEKSKAKCCEKIENKIGG